MGRGIKRVAETKRRREWTSRMAMTMGGGGKVMGRCKEARERQALRAHLQIL